MSETVPSAVSRAPLDRIDEAMQRCVDTTPIPGIVTLLYRRGELLHHKAFGVLGPGGEPMRPDAIFRIYSMTKPIVCAALLTLYEEGAFRLSDPVARFIPEFAQVRVYAGPEPAESPAGAAPVTLEGTPTTEPLRAVTVHDLLTHSAGLTYPWMEYGPVEELYRRHVSHLSDQPLADLVRQVAVMPLAFQPGTRFRYGLCHDVAARLVEVVAGVPLDRFLQQRIFEPLGMTDTGFFVPLAEQHRFAAMIGARDPADVTASRSLKLAAAGRFDWISNPETDLEYRPHRAFRGGHGLVSTAADYLRFCAMLLGRGTLGGARILCRQTVELMTGNQLPAALLPFEVNGREQRGYGYGLGVRVLLDPAASRRSGSVGEYGWAGAANTYFRIDPVEESVAIFLAQIRPAGYFRVAEEFRELACAALAA